MPESRQRRKRDYTPPSQRKRAPGAVQRRWVAPAMVACWLVGLAWIVVYYIVPDIAGFSSLGNWNLAIGMALIAVGFVLSTKWE